jgi:hypothetical protein
MGVILFLHEKNSYNIQDKVQLNKFLYLCFQLNINIYKKQLKYSGFCLMWV